MSLWHRHSHTLEFSIVDFGLSIENRCSIGNRQSTIINRQFPGLSCIEGRGPMAGSKPSGDPVGVF